MSTISLIISILALLIAFSGFYLQYFHTKDSVVCTLAAYNFEGRNPAVRIVVSNLGTRSILLRSARMLVIAATEGGGNRSYDPANHISVPKPILIPKGEIASVDLTLTLPEDGRLYFKNWEEIKRLDGYVPYTARLIFVTGSGKTLISEKLVQQVRYGEECASFIPLNKDSWQVGSPTFENLQII